MAYFKIFDSSVDAQYKRFVVKQSIIINKISKNHVEGWEMDIGKKLNIKLK